MSYVRTFVVAATIASLAIVLSGCDNDPDSDSGVFFPTHESADVPSSQAFGDLLLRENCLLIQTEGSDELLPLWPQGYSFRDGALYDETGESIAEVGDPLALGGGEVDIAVALDLIDADIPDSCSEASPFVVSGVARGSPG